MIFGKRCFCILCKRYKNVGKMCFVHNNIAICYDCVEKLKTTTDKTFEAIGDIKMVLSPYLYTGKLKRAIKDFKFAGQWLYGKVLGRLLSDGLKEHMWLSEYDCIIPVPLHQIRLLERGYNQSELLAEEVSEWLGLPMVNDVLFRLRNTERQSRLRGIERIENVKGAFGAFGNYVTGKKIILIDDIYTAGETARACADALKKSGAGEIVVITLCKAKY